MGQIEEERIIRLRAELLEHNRRYYVDNAPSISDYEYDMLMNELIALEQEYPELVTDDSPTRRVGSDLGDNSGDFVQRPHRYPMLSLGNTYNIGEIEDFVNRARKGTGSDFDFCCELKFDGTAICLTYRNGSLVRALTRGDGIEGDDVTRNVRMIKSIPTRLSGSGYPDEFEIRGEIYMPYESFDRLCSEREDSGEEPFANPRNAASGSLKLQDSREVGHRGLECTLYHILGENLPWQTHDEALRAAASWGLPVSDKRKVCSGIDEIEKFIGEWDEGRRHLPFATDGVVVKINQLPVQRELGFTSKFPRWAVAYKFKAEQACTAVLSIDYQVGRTGAVTPVANLEPVPLSGTVVKRATLHNFEQMDSLDIRVGDWVYVEKGGEIIPKITAVELSRRPVEAVKPVFPTHCPDCGTPLVRSEGEAKWYCPNTNGCPTQAKETLIHFLSRKAMNIMGVAEAAVGQMYDLGIVRTPADFYSLTYSQLYRLDGWKDKSCENFLKSLEESRKVSFEHVLFALSIRFVGETTAKTLARHFRNIDALISADKEALLAVGDIGEVIAGSLLNYFADPVNISNINRLRDAGLQFSIDEGHGAAGTSLQGKTIVISGTFSTSREAMKERIEANGGKLTSSVSSSTSFLLAGQKPGPEKLRKAGSLGIDVVSEEEFNAMCGITETAPKPGTELTLF